MAWWTHFTKKEAEVPSPSEAAAPASCPSGTEPPCPQARHPLNAIIRGDIWGLTICRVLLQLHHKASLNYSLQPLQGCATNAYHNEKMKAQKWNLGDLIWESKAGVFFSLWRQDKLPRFIYFLWLLLLTLTNELYLGNTEKKSPSCPIHLPSLFCHPALLSSLSW